MANIESVKTSLDKENNGIWIEFAEGIQLKIARARNPKSQELARDLLGPKIIDKRNDKLEMDVINDVMMQVRAKTILLDWKNIEENDKAVPYSPEKALEYFKNPELKDFYTFVISVSENADQYKKDLVESSEKN